MKRLTLELAASIAVVSLVVLCCATSACGSVLLDFETLSDSEVVTTQYSGLTFSNAIAVKAGVSLNEFDFPPKSGKNVVSDNSGPMRVDFDVPVASVGGFFTYIIPLMLTAFDSSNMVLGSAASLYTENFLSSGNPPNELLQLTFPNISYVTITGDPNGSSFTLDDLSYDVTVIPEPTTCAIWTILIGVAGWWRRRAA